VFFFECKIRKTKDMFAKARDRIKQGATSIASSAKKAKNAYTQKRKDSINKNTQKQTLFDAERKAKMAFNRNTKNPEIRKTYINARAAANKVRTRTNKLKRATVGKYQTYRNNKAANRNSIKSIAREGMHSFREGDVVTVPDHSNTNGNRIKQITINTIIENNNNYIISYLGVDGIIKEETFNKNDVKYTDEMDKMIKSINMNDFNKSFGQTLSNKAKSVALKLNPFSSQNKLNYKESKICTGYKTDADNILSKGILTDLDFKYVTDKQSGQTNFVIKQTPMARNGYRDMSSPIKMFSGDSLVEALGKLKQCDDDIKSIKKQRNVTTKYKDVYNTAKNTTLTKLRTNRSNANKNIQIHDLNQEISKRKNEIANVTTEIERLTDKLREYDKTTYNYNGNQIEYREIKLQHNTKNKFTNRLKNSWKEYASIQTRHEKGRAQIMLDIRMNRGKLAMYNMQLNNLFKNMKKLNPDYTAPVNNSGLVEQDVSEDAFGTNLTALQETLFGAEEIDPLSNNRIIELNKLKQHIPKLPQ
jgi:hypothetical protein